jgi:hypothetical protein
MTYPEAMQAVQTGIAYEIELEGEAGAGCSPKHLRVGISSGAVSQAAIASLLIEKGIITLDEYMTALTVVANKEAKCYEEILSKKLGREIKLL